MSDHQVEESNRCLRLAAVRLIYSNIKGVETGRRAVESSLSPSAVVLSATSAEISDIEGSITCQGQILGLSRNVCESQEEDVEYAEHAFLSTITYIPIHVHP